MQLFLYEILFESLHRKKISFIMSKLHHNKVGICCSVLPWLLFVLIWPCMLYFCVTLHCFFSVHVPQLCLTESRFISPVVNVYTAFILFCVFSYLSSLGLVCVCVFYVCVVCFVYFKLYTSIFQYQHFCQHCLNIVYCNVLYILYGCKVW